ncbi:MAG TPA: hypothetical protein V6C76_06860 [Drouetiella sp.]
MFELLQKRIASRRIPRLCATAIALWACVCGAAFAADDDSESKPFLFPTTKDFPKLPTTGPTTKAFLPKHFHVIARAQGDLNHDGLSDQALVIQATYPKFVQKNSNLGSVSFDTNPRALVVLFKNSSGAYALAEQNWYIIGIPESPTIENPFQSISITNKSILKVDLQMFENAGSWWMSNDSFKFRWDGHRLALIGYDSRSQSRASGQYTKLSCNFLTGQKRVDDCTEEPGKVKVEKSLLNKKTCYLKDFAHQNDWTELPEKF